MFGFSTFSEAPFSTLPSSGAFLNAFVSENSQASINLSAALINICGISETSNVNSQVAVAASIFNTFVSEILTTANQVSATANFAVTIVQNVISSEFVVSIATLNSSSNNSVQALNIINGFLVVDSVVNENSQASLQIDAEYIINFNIIEDAQALDELVVAASNFNATVSDSVLPNDEPSVAASNFNATVANLASALDAPSTGVIFIVSTDDSATVQDIVASLPFYRVDINEVTQVFDAVTSSLLWEIINTQQALSWSGINTNQPVTWTEINTQQSVDWKVITTIN